MTETPVDVASKQPTAATTHQRPPAPTRVSFRPIHVAAMVGSVPFFATVYYYAGMLFTGSPLTYLEYLMFSSVVAVSVLGAYQLYFWIQRNNHFFPTRCLKISLDDWIPFVPSCVWIYNFFYYFLIGYVVISIRSISQGVAYLFGGVVLLIAQSVCFFLLPCTVPESWRQYRADTLSKRFLRFAQKFDNGRNCWPSMHCSVCMYVSLILEPSIGGIAYVFVALIVLSCLMVKQHQILDVPPGLAFGGLAYWLIKPLAAAV